jgi:hypothetical protein
MVTEFLGSDHRLAFLTEHSGSETGSVGGTYSAVPSNSHLLFFLDPAE